MSCNAWQLVSISTGNPHMVSSNLSSVNFRAANSNMNGLYFSSEVDVHFDAKAMGCSLVTTLPFGSVSVNLWASTAPNPSLHPSDVTINGVPSKRGALRTGWDVNICLRPKNAFLWVDDQQSASLTFRRAVRYAAFPEFLGIAAALSKSESG